MQQAAFFHRAFLLFFAAVVMTRVFYQVRHRTYGVNLSLAHERRATAVLRLLLGVPLMLVIGLYLLAPATLSWTLLPLPGWLRWAGLALGWLALALLIWVHQSLSANFSPTLQLQPDHRLIIAGPYRWVRHPMYSVLFLLHCAYLLITASWLIGGLALLVITVIMVLRTPEEEQQLLSRFGDDYRAYTQRTGQFLPRHLGTPKKLYAK